MASLWVSIDVFSVGVPCGSLKGFGPFCVRVLVFFFV